MSNNIVEIFSVIPKQEIICDYCNKKSGIFIDNIEDLFEKVPAGWLTKFNHPEYPSYKLCSLDCFNKKM